MEFTKLVSASISLRIASFAFACLFTLLNSYPLYGHKANGPIEKGNLLSVLSKLKNKPVREQRSAQELIIKEVKKNGVNFEMTLEVEKELKEVGANADLIEAIRQKSRPPIVTEAPLNNPGVTGVSILIISMKGQDDPRGHQIAEELEAMKYIVEGPWANDAGSKTDKSAVRYFHRKDRKLSQDIIEYIRRKTGIELEPAMGINPTPVPEGYLEIWLK